MVTPRNARTGIRWPHHYEGIAWVPLDQSRTGSYPFLSIQQERCRQDPPAYERTFPIPTTPAYQVCISPACRATYDVGETHVACGRCGGLLDVAYDWSRIAPPRSWKVFEDKWGRRARSALL